MNFEPIRINNFSKFGEHANHRLLVSITRNQKERIRAMAETSGFATVSSFVRFHLLNPSLDMKINEILRIVKELQEKIPPCKCRKQTDELRCKK